jgi:succinate dehydrogenase/fumarate reductase flavoprotein subunit
MTNNCGVFRDAERLNMAWETLTDVQERMGKARVMDKGNRFNTDLLAALEARHLLTISQTIVAGAIARTESRGAHSRIDFPTRDDDGWLRHTMAHKSDSAAPTLTYKSVNIDWEKYPPQQRKY